MFHVNPLRKTAIDGPSVRRSYGAALFCALFGFGGVASTGWAQSHGHRMIMPEELKWADVPSLPQGAKIAIIEGPMSEAAPFTVRLRFPADYKLPPHWHPAVERVTVLSGTFNMGMGDKFDPSKTHAVKAGAIAIMQPKIPHFAWTKTETVVQLHGVGPWGITYLNPNDDPRKK